MGAKRKEITKVGVKAQGGNFHTNFVDLNPSWSQARHKRAVERANVIVGDMSGDLLAKYHEKHLKIFEKSIASGKRLGYEDLRKLAPEYKSVYKKVI